MTLGAFHTGLQHEMKRMGIATERTFSAQDMPQKFVYGYRSEVQRAYRFGREPSQEVLENAWVEQVLDVTVMAKTALKNNPERSTANLYAYYRQVVGNMSERDKTAVYDLLSHDAYDLGPVEVLFNMSLADVGQPPLPQTPAELNARLKDY